MKRPFDFILSLIGFVLLAPLFVVLCVLIKLDSDGPVFYRGVRVGRFGKPFRIFKFRTMVTDAEKVGGSSTPEDDPRVTRIGRSLRKYKLDELPQLFNVMKGEMSLVGPRPQVPWAAGLYTEEEKAVLGVRPGITDYASLQFRNEAEILRGSSDPDKAYLEKIHPEKMRLSLEYVHNQSLWLDCKILLTTLGALAFLPGCGPPMERAKPKATSEVVSKRQSDAFPGGEHP
jgi:lipopolysaccharide/colanic/teichoic acid biosynthesis glycosyltransferase